MATTGINWPPPPADSQLSADEVQVWAVALDLPANEMARLEQLLSGEERQRADQFKLPHLCERFTVARATLRRILGTHLDCDPAILEFDYTPRGKPFLTGRMAGRLHFNLAHSGELALIAVTQLVPVGVDVERVRPMPDALGIAERFFSARELKALQNLAMEVRDAAFFSLWTRKEAWLKATGDGIAESLSKIEVAFLPNETPRVLAIAGDPGAAAGWSLLPLSPVAGFIGALAIHRREVRLKCWRFES